MKLAHRAEECLSLYRQRTLLRTSVLPLMMCFGKTQLYLQRFSRIFLAEMRRRLSRQ